MTTAITPQAAIPAGNAALRIAGLHVHCLQLKPKALMTCLRKCPSRLQMAFGCRSTSCIQAPRFRTRRIQARLSAQHFQGLHACPCIAVTTFAADESSRYWGSTGHLCQEGNDAPEAASKAEGAPQLARDLSDAALATHTHVRPDGLHGVGDLCQQEYPSDGVRNGTVVQARKLSRFSMLTARLLGQQ